MDWILGIAVVAPVRYGEGAQSLVRRLRAHVAGWRAGQAHMELLEQHVRLMLGARFDDLGELVMTEIKQLSGMRFVAREYVVR